MFYFSLLGIRANLDFFKFVHLYSSRVQGSCIPGTSERRRSLNRRRGSQRLSSRRLLPRRHRPPMSPPSCTWGTRKNPVLQNLHKKSVGANPSRNLSKMDCPTVGYHPRDPTAELLGILSYRSGDPISADDLFFVLVPNVPFRFKPCNQKCGFSPKITFKL